MRNIILLFLILIATCATGLGQTNKYYTSMPHDSGAVYFIKPVELKLQDKKDEAYVDWAVNYSKNLKCSSSTYMNFSIFTKNKPAHSDTAWVVLNSGAKFRADNFIAEKRKKGIWKLRYTSTVSLNDVNSIFNQEGEQLFEVIINDTHYYFTATAKWEKAKDFLDDFIVSLCE